MIQRIIRELDKHARFLVTTHVRPDGDAVGSLLAMGEVLQQLGKSVRLFCKDSLLPWQRELPGASTISNHIEELLDDFDAAIVLDCGELGRVGDNNHFISGIPVLINIDHHIAREPFTELRLANTKASSTAEILYDLFVSLGIDWTSSICTNLYVGIFTDTGSFRFSNTTERSLEIASFLVKKGVQPDKIAQVVYGSCSLNRFRLLCKVLETLNVGCNGRVACIQATRKMFKETSTTSRDTEDFINFPRSLKDIKIALFFREEEDGIINVSFRSIGDVNVAKLASKFGGGGHFNAAACRFRGSNLDDVKAEILEATNEYLQSER